ncbi:MAG: hypothetical protein N2491_05680 [Negativicutes bacterium]|nr:hypothetical protein [Negativicutes bacterium]
MIPNKPYQPTPPLDGTAVQTLEHAINQSPTKSIFLEINSTLYQISREGRWFKFSLLNKKRTVKRSAVFATITEIYNQVMHGQHWRIADLALNQ